MNIFAVDVTPSKCAIWHVDKHVVKQILETAQILSVANILNGLEAPYKLTHVNHPVTKWARNSSDNFSWLLELGLNLCREYTYRYGKIHKTEEKLKSFMTNKPALPKGFTKFALAMPDEYKTNDPVESYRRYYIYGKSHLAKWKNREIPEWYKK